MKDIYKYILEKLRVNKGKHFDGELILGMSVINILDDYVDKVLGLKYSNYIVDFIKSTGENLSANSATSNNTKYIDIYCDEFANDPEKVEKDITERINKMTDVKVVNSSIMRKGVEIFFEVCKR